MEALAALGPHGVGVCGGISAGDRAALFKRSGDMGVEVDRYDTGETSYYYMLPRQLSKSVAID